jgi:hypothetical protein
MTICFYKKPISQTETNIGLNWKAGKRFSKQMAPQNRQKELFLYQIK